MSNNEYLHEEILNDLTILMKMGLVDAVLDEDNEWRYKPSNKMMTMTLEEIHNWLEENK